MEHFVGREPLVAQLDATLDAAAAGRGSLVVMAGEPGIGKTRLAQECVRPAGKRGFTAARAACTEDAGAPGSGRRQDLSVLLVRPGWEPPALDLAGAPGAPPGGGDLGELLDPQARAAYKARLTEFEEEIADADRSGDAHRSARAVAERDALVEQLTAAYGLGSRAGRAGDAAGVAADPAEIAHPELGGHLRHAVRTGRYVAYDRSNRPSGPPDEGSSPDVSRILPPTGRTDS